MDPRGVVWDGTGVDVSVSAPDADEVELCLFTSSGESRHRLTPLGDGVHGGHVADVRPGAEYGFRVHGPWDPSKGWRHDPARLLLDPYARAVSGRFVDHPSVHDDHPPDTDTAPHVPRGVVVTAPDAPRPGPGVPWADTVIYETHVRGMTMLHPDVAPHLRGTYLGLASEPVIEHLLRLGVTTVELMPVAHHVDEPFLQHRGLTNYWGYSTLAWFAPHGGYATADDGRQVAEFAEMVDRLHQAGLEVVVDVVFNHTAEGGADGPVLSMKGLDNRGWYRLEPSDPSTYLDWTGTGNTVDTGSPLVRAAILDALRWWATGLGVDGFRFDLAVTLGRADTSFDADALGWIVEDPVVGATKLIAEPWDLGPDGYRVGEFGRGWSEWNGPYRDDIRDVWRGQGSRGALAVRFAGSPDLFPDRGPCASIDFVTAHDGFTLADLVSYDRKHNEDNREANHDGHDDNRSWNSGVEGPTDDPSIRETRRRRSAALLTTLLLSSGVPMILGGDELGRGQAGNNNAYPLDSPISWFDWSEQPFTDTIAEAIRLRRSHRLLGSRRFLTGDVDERDVVRARWHDPDGGAMSEWDTPGPISVEIHDGRDQLLVAFNPTDAAVTMHLPGRGWRLRLCSDGRPDSVQMRGRHVRLPPWSVAVLAAG